MAQAKDKPQALGGSCQCGGIVYTLRSEPSMVTHCHCKMCRKMHGAAFATWACFADTDVKFVKESTRKSYNSSAGAVRTFCSTCGANISMQYHAEKGHIWLTPGTFDFEPQVKPTYHIYTHSKAGWYEICDKLRQYGGSPGSSDQGDE